MKPSKITLVLSLAALLGGGLMLPGAAAAHDRHSSFKVERQHQEQRSDRHQKSRNHTHRSNDNWYLQRHREARYYDYRPMKHHKKHGHKHTHKVRRHNRREVQRVHQPAPVQHEYRRISPLRLEIGYEIVL